MSRVVLITGAATGMGLAGAKVFGKAGYTVVITGIEDAQGPAALKELSDEGIIADFYKCNATDENEVNEVIKTIGEKYGKIDTLVNNVGGLGGRSRFEEMTTEFFRFVMALNYDSAFFTTRAAIPYLKKGENASVINYTSIAAYNGGGPGAGVYGASKGAVLTLTIALAKDLAEYGIRVNAVSPGTIDTAFHSATDPKIVDSWKSSILAGRLGRPDEVAQVIEFLASEKASFITGEIVQINGGQDFR